MNTTPVIDELCRATTEKLLANLAQVIDRTDAIEIVLKQNDLRAYRIFADYYWSYCTPDNIEAEQLLLDEFYREGIGSVHYARERPPIIGYQSVLITQRLEAAGVDRRDPMALNKISQRQSAEDEHIRRDQPGALAKSQATIPLKLARKREEALAYAARMPRELLNSFETSQQLALFYFQDFGFKPQRGRRQDKPFALRRLSENVNVGLVHKNAARGDFSISSGNHGLDMYFEIKGKNDLPLTFKKGVLDFVMGIRVYHECDSLEDVHLAYFVQRTVYSAIADLIEIS